jgi:hypothetical protein
MMQQIIVKCPNCGANVDLSKAVEDELLRSLKEEIRQTVDLEKVQELAELKKQLQEKSKELSDSQKLEVELRKKKMELEEKEERMELDIVRQLDEGRKQIAKQAREKAEEESRLKIKEYETQLNSLQEELVAVQRKADQGSQQLQGESAELDLEDLLKQNFPYDEIIPVGKGVKGADVHQRVQTREGNYCGMIIWESKYTKNWSEGWKSKLKTDQLNAKADFAILASDVLPDEIHHFGCVDGVWISGFPYILSLATALRESLIQVELARRSFEGKDQKIDRLYKYLSGLEFRQRVEMVVNTFEALKKELNGEKRAMTRIWSQREKSLENMTLSVSGMYGDLQGIIGAALPSISALELPEGVEENYD